jgi:ABC-2 type transport system permease protein
MLAVIKKELKSYLLSPIGFIFSGLFLLMFSLLFYISIFYYRSVYFEYAFYDAATIMTFLIPVLTMRMFSEERKSGTEQLLLTSPRSLVSVVLGKFIAAVIIILIAICGTLIHLAILRHFGTPDLKVAAVTLFGFFLLSCAYVSFGMFASSITENQIVACVLTIAVFIAMWFLPHVSPAFENISLMNKFDHFPSGVIALNEVVTFVSFSILFILLTIIVLQRRKSVK